MESIGEASPMGILWTFMGSSRPYTIFGGLAEMVPGLMLFFPPVAGLAAILCSAVMFHIFMLNMCYDVPVKIYSFQLLMTAVYLALPQIKRILGFLVFNRRVEPLPVVPFFKHKAGNEMATALQVLFGLVLAGQTMQGASLREKREHLEIATRDPMYGIWMVDECVLPEKPPSIGKVGKVASPWQKVVCERMGYTVVYMEDGARKRYSVEVHPEDHKIILSGYDDPKWQRVYSTTEQAPNVVTLDGGADGVPSHMKLHKIDESGFILKGRGFHWINEYPVNR
jgi:hypothetical protein